MRRPSKKKVLRLLAKNQREQKIAWAIRNAWDEVQSQYPGVTWYRRKTTIRELMWEHTIQHLVGFADKDSGWRHLDRDGTVYFTLEDRLMFRFKKADRELFSSNIPTGVALLFHDPEADLFGFRGFQRIEAVYVPNSNNTRVVWAGLVARTSSFVIWKHELRLPASGAQIRTLPQRQRPPVTSLVKPKSITKGKKKGKSTKKP